MFVAGAAILSAMVAIGFAALWRRAVRRAREARLAFGDIRQTLAEVTAEAQRGKTETARLRNTLDLLPIPVWRRRDNSLIECNKAYATLAGSRETALAKARGLVPVGPADTSSQAPNAATQFTIHAAIGGLRHLLDIHELPGADGETLAFAFDRTEVESAQRELRRHIAANAAVLEILAAGVAIFGPDKRLKLETSNNQPTGEKEPGLRLCRIRLYSGRLYSGRLVTASDVPRRGPALLVDLWVRLVRSEQPTRPSVACCRRGWRGRFWLSLGPDQWCG